jgi:hypothetical protein|tara:strand:- start:1466 stop:1792 length:327 start_codon:yes stop_codon:yes gene_type:complete
MPEAYKNAYQDVGTSSTAIYQCPASTEAIVKSLIICNVDGTNSAEITAEVLDSDGSAGSKFASTITVPADSTIELIQNFIILEAQDSIKLLASATGDLEAIASVVEIT